MASSDYQIAKGVLTDKDKDRLVCLYLARRPDGNVDWDKATSDFQCASVSSMKTMTYNVLKKIENAGGKIGAAAASASASPAPKKSRSKKRKTSTPVDDDDEEEATPVTKKQSRKKKDNGSVSGSTENGSGIKGEPVSGDEDGVTS